MSTNLYCFRQYTYMEARIKAFRDRFKKRESIVPPGIGLIGTPGIGKLIPIRLFIQARQPFREDNLSCLLSYPTLQLALSQPTVCFWKGDFFVFTTEGVHKIYSPPYFGMGWKFVVFLVDADRQNPLRGLMVETVLFVVAASSPNPALRQFIKHPAGLSQEFVINPPDRDELVTVLVNHSSPFALLTFFSLRDRNLPNVSGPDIKSAISTYGYNIRVLIQVLALGSENVDRLIANKVDQLTTVDIRSLVKLQRDSAESVADSLILRRCPKQPEAGTLAYFTSDVVKNVVGSCAIWKALVHIHGKKLYSKATNMTEFFHRVPGMAPTAGRLWKSICHTKVSEGGTFIFREMCEDVNGMLALLADPISIYIRQMEPLQYGSADNLSAATLHRKYLQPSASDNCTFDSLFFHGDTGIGPQMTLAPMHTLNPKGLQELHKRLGKRTANET